MNEHAHHWQTETPTGGRMRCNCGAFYLNGKIIASQDDTIQFVGPDLPTESDDVETIQQVTFAEERRVLMTKPGEWALLVRNINSRDATSATQHTSRRRASAREAEVASNFKFAQRVTYRNPDSRYDTASSVFGRYYPNGVPRA